jgi:KRAB domain-containing zinc finger protein
VGQEVVELASILGVTYLTEKIQIHANNEKKPDKKKLLAHAGEVQGLPDKKIPPSIDLSNLTPETEKYLKEIIWKNKNFNSKTKQQIEPLSQKQSKSINTDGDGHFMPLFVENSTEKVSQKQEFLKDDSTMKHKTQHGTTEAPNSCSKILAERSITSKSQDPVEKLQSDRGSSRVCHECGVVLSSRNALKNHQSTKHDSEGYKYHCDQCKYQTAHKEGLEKHISTHHDNIRYPSNLCDYKATQKSSLKIHTESKHEGAQFTCKICGKIFSLKQAQRRHMEYSHGQRRYKCDSCDYIAGQAHHLTTHKEIKHGDLFNIG